MTIRRRRIVADDSERAAWTKFKLDWLVALAQAEPPRVAVLIGVLLALKYVNSQSRDAWPSIRTLAHELTVARSSVQRALDWLIGNGWLVYDRGGQGRGDSSHYRLAEPGFKGRVDATLKQQKGRVDASIRAA